LSAPLLATGADEVADAVLCPTEPASAAINQLRELKLDGMADVFTELQPRIAPRTSATPSARPRGGKPQYQACQRRLRAARLRHGQATIEAVDYRTPRQLDKALFQQLATCRWIAEHRNLLVTGPCEPAS
jgi:DNA replication protein DnaC